MEYIKGLVSVVIPTYKRSGSIVRSIQSVLNQTYKDIELLLVNDNENDDVYTENLLSTVRPFESDPRFHLVIQEKHINGAAARNVGIKKARGEFVAFLDDDDWWEKDKIEKQIATISSLDETWGCVSCKFSLYDDKGNIIGKTEKYNDGLIFKDILYLMTDVATGTILVRHKVLDDVGCFDEALPRHQDLQLLVSITSKYKLKEVDEFLHCCDVSDGQNRLDGDKLIATKKLFYKSVEKQMEILSKKELKCVYAMNDFEIGYVYLKSHKFWKGIKFISHLLKSPMAIKKAIQKINARKRIYKKHKVN